MAKVLRQLIEPDGDLYGNGGPGSYRVAVTGNGKTLTFYVNLTD